MPYLFLVFAIVAVVFISLGALAVKASILGIAVKVLSFLLTIIGVLYLWKGITGRKP